MVALEAWLGGRELVFNSVRPLFVWFCVCVCESVGGCVEVSLLP